MTYLLIALVAFVMFSRALWKDREDLLRAYFAYLEAEYAHTDYSVNYTRESRVFYGMLVLLTLVLAAVWPLTAIGLLFYIFFGKE